MITSNTLTIVAPVLHEMSPEEFDVAVEALGEMLHQHELVQEATRSTSGKRAA